jgi:hypothetical protein
LRTQADAIAGPVVLTLIEQRHWLARVVRANLALLNLKIGSELLVKTDATVRLLVRYASPSTSAASAAREPPRPPQTRKPRKQRPLLLLNLTHTTGTTGGRSLPRCAAGFERERCHPGDNHRARVAGSPTPPPAPPAS